jgi:hypothetical protein
MAPALKAASDSCTRVRCPCDLLAHYLVLLPHAHGAGMFAASVTRGLQTGPPASAPGGALHSACCELIVLAGVEMLKELCLQESPAAK